MKDLSPSRLRANLYRILDQVLATGRPVHGVRRGRLLRITPEGQGRLHLLRPHPEYLDGDPEEPVHLDWSDRWRP